MRQPIRRHLQANENSLDTGSLEEDIPPWLGCQVRVGGKYYDAQRPLRSATGDNQRREKPDLNAQVTIRRTGTPESIHTQRIPTFSPSLVLLESRVIC